MSLHHLMGDYAEQCQRCGHIEGDEVCACLDQTGGRIVRGYIAIDVLREWTRAADLPALDYFLEDQAGR